MKFNSFQFTLICIVQHHKLLCLLCPSTHNQGGKKTAKNPFMVTGETLQEELRREDWISPEETQSTGVSSEYISIITGKVVITESADTPQRRPPILGYFDISSNVYFLLDKTPELLTIKQICSHCADSADS